MSIAKVMNAFAWFMVGSAASLVTIMLIAGIVSSGVIGLSMIYLAIAIAAGGVSKWAESNDEKQ